MNTAVTSLMNKRRNEIRIAATVFLLPVIILLVIYIVYPIIDSFDISLYKWNGITSDREYIGMENWKALVTDGTFWSSFINNLKIMFLSIAIQLPIGLALATFLDFGGKKLNIFKVAWFLPLLMSSVAVGFLFKFALATYGGMISTVSSWIGGGNVDLLGNPDRALITVIAVICWQFIPFYMVFFMAAYTNISYDIYEAAKVDGATKGQYFWKIALPLLFPSIKSAAILSMVGSLMYFDLVFTMTSGGPGTSTEIMATYMYRMSFRTFNMGYGSTIACGMFLLITVIALITMRFLSFRKEQ